MVLRGRVTMICLILISWNRATELRLTLIPRVRLSELHFGISEVNDLSDAALERTSRDQARQQVASRPRDFQRSTTRTEQGIGLLTIPVLAAGGQFGQAKFALSGDSISPGQSH